MCPKYDWYKVYFQPVTAEIPMDFKLVPYIIKN
jgi:hypothetical protein